MRSPRANVWVVLAGKKYSIIEEGRKKHLVLPATQREAIRIARLIAKANRSELIVQNRHARIRVKDSHGHDSPYRPG